MSDTVPTVVLLVQDEAILSEVQSNLDIDTAGMCLNNMPAHWLCQCLMVYRNNVTVNDNGLLPPYYWMIMATSMGSIM